MDSLVGKSVVVNFEETQVISLAGEVIAHDEKGVLLKRIYRKGIRLEFIPKEKIINLFHDEKKPRRSSAKAAPVETPVKAEKAVSLPPTAPVVNKLINPPVIKDLSAELNFEDELESDSVISVAEEDDEWGDD